MKKFAKIAALALVVVMSLAMLVACAPNSNPDKAIEALKKNGYTAAKDANVVPAFATAPPTKPTLVGVKGVDTVISGTKSSGEGDDAKVDHVTVIYFASADQAKTAWDKVKSYAEKDKDSKDSDWTITQSGKMIYYGTKAGIAAAR